MMKTLLIAFCFFGLCASVQVGPVPFSWKNCGSNSDPVQLKTLSISPSPIVINGNISLTVAGASTATVAGGKLELSIHKRILGIWTEIPCIDNFGSCTYDNYCTLIAGSKPLCTYLSKWNIPCQCPYKPGAYSIPPGSQLGPITIPSGYSWLSDGSYEVQATLYDSNGGRLMCLFVELSLEAGAVVLSA